MASAMQFLAFAPRPACPSGPLWSPYRVGVRASYRSSISVSQRTCSSHWCLSNVQSAARRQVHSASSSSGLLSSASALDRRVGPTSRIQTMIPAQQQQMRLYYRYPPLLSSPPPPPAQPSKADQDEEGFKRDARQMISEIKNPTPITTSIARKTNATISAMPGKIRETASKLARGFMSAMFTFIKNPKVAKHWYRVSAEVIKHASQHYWIGTKLLWADFRTATRLVLKVVKGYTLTRRERAQLVRTAGDLFRLVPFAVFVIVPFAELLLPVALKLFPNMLPSTYEDKMKKEQLFKKQLMARIELAKFLQDTVEEMAEEIGTGENTEEMKKQAAELREFIRKVRQGELVSNDDIIKYSKLFSNEITLDNISRPQLVALSKYMGLSPFGGDGFLRFQLRNKLRQLGADDRMIHWEGAASLSQDELVAACRDRGMRYIGLPKEHLIQQLNEWIELSLNKSVPALLLLLSRAFTITTERHFIDTTQALQSTISAFSDEMLHQVLPSDHENARRLEELLHQEKLIEQEAKEREEQEAKRQAAAQATLGASSATTATTVEHVPAATVVAPTTPAEAPLYEKKPLEEAKETPKIEDISEEEEEELEDVEQRPEAVLHTMRRELDDHVQETEQLGEHLAMDAVEKRIKKLLDTISKDIDVPKPPENEEHHEANK